MIKYKTNAFIFLEFLQPILIIFIITFTTSCQSDNNIDKSNSNNENTGKIVFVANTSQDNESPWLAFRDEPKYDGKLIYMLPDGTRLKVIGEDSSGNFAKVQIIDNIGYVSKKYLSDNLISIKSDEDILVLSKLILENLKKGNINIIANYMYNNSIDYFYWKISKSQLQNGSYKYSPDYNGTDAISGQPFSVQIKNYLDFSEWNVKYLRNEGKGFFPGSGFGGGSVAPPDKEDYIVRVADLNLNMPGHELWFIYKKVNNTYKLKILGDWDWTP
jgi:hypothetical protein